jgi:hypothetical protein
MNSVLNAAPSDAFLWILYLDPSVHTKEYTLVKNASLESFIHLQDIRDSVNVMPPRPEWLDVMPVLVDTRMRLAYRGHSCMDKLVSIELPPEHLKRLTKAAGRKLKW